MYRRKTKGGRPAGRPEAPPVNEPTPVWSEPVSEEPTVEDYFGERKRGRKKNKEVNEQ